MNSILEGKGFLQDVIKNINMCGKSTHLSTRIYKGIIRAYFFYMNGSFLVKDAETFSLKQFYMSFSVNIFSLINHENSHPVFRQRWVSSEQN